LTGQSWQGTHPAGSKNYYEAKSAGVSAISRAGTATVNRENGQKIEKRRSEKPSLF
jgi:hypothetical protein